MKALAFCLVATFALAQPAAALTDKFNITPVEHAACDADAARLCMEAYPDEDALFSCMKQKHAQLTPVCLTVFVAGVKRRHMHM